MKVYDPAYGYEIAHIVRAGVEQMYGVDSPDPNVMYYVGAGSGPKVQLLGSGVSVPWAQEAARILDAEWAVSADVWSVTSWVELRRDGLRALDANLLHPDAEPRVPYLTRKLAGAEGPVVAATDYVSEVPDQVRQFVPNPWATLGADRHGFSDTRAAARRFFRTDSHAMVVRALQLLAEQGQVDAGAAAEPARRYRLDDVTAGSTGTSGGHA